MSIKSSIFANKTSDAELQYMARGVLPPLVSPTLPAVYTGVAAPPIKLDPVAATPRTAAGPETTSRSAFGAVVRNGSNSYTVPQGRHRSLVVTLKVAGPQAGLGLGIRVAGGAESVTKAHRDGAGNADKTKKDGAGDLGKSRREDGPEASGKSTEHRDSAGSATGSATGQAATPTKPEPALAEKRREKSELFLGKSKHYRNLAAAKKRESDRYIHEKRELVRAIRLAAESVVTFFVSFDYEDKSRLVEKKLASDKSWLTLLPYLNSVLKIIDDSPDKEIRFKTLYAVANLLKAACLQHIVELALAAVKNFKARIDRDQDGPRISRLKDMIVERSVSIADHDAEARACFTRFERYLNHVEVKLNFPQTFKRRSLTVEPQQGQESLKPAADLYYIPLGHYSSLHEIAAFVHRVLQELDE